MTNPTTRPEDVPVHNGWLARLIHEETGAVLLEYVTLLVFMFLSVEATAKPLQDALMQFAANVYDHLNQL